MMASGRWITWGLMAACGLCLVSSITYQLERDFRAWNSVQKEPEKTITFELDTPEPNVATMPDDPPPYRGNNKLKWSSSADDDEQIWWAHYLPATEHMSLNPKHVKTVSIGRDGVKVPFDAIVELAKLYELEGKK